MPSFFPKILLLMGLLLPAQVLAQQGPPSSGLQTPSQTAAERDAERNAAASAADAAAIPGPSSVKLGDKGVLQLPAGMSWIPRSEADRFMRASGHLSNQDLLGLVSGSTEGHTWIGLVEFTGEGYIKDDDAKDLDPAKLLASLREGTEESNKGRVQRGFLPLSLDDWLEPPSYDAANKRLVWALPVHTSENTDKPTINYNTRALGREGFFSLDLLTDRDHFAAEKGAAVTLLQNISYTPGHRYADFNPSTDQVAAYGLAALIGVVALKKLGLLAIATAFILKFAKVGAVACIVLFAGIKRFLGLRKKDKPTA